MNAAGAVQLKNLLTMILSIVREPDSMIWTTLQNLLLERIYAMGAYSQVTPVIIVIEKEIDAPSVNGLTPNYCLILRYCHYNRPSHYQN